MNDMTITDLKNRLNQLERSNRNIKRSLVGVGLSAIVLLSLGAAQAEQSNPQKDVSCDTMRARRVVISDQDGHERLVLELDSGEPTLKMLNHEGHRQVFLGIDESWEDTAYLSISSRLQNGDVDKQAMIAATTSRPNSLSSTQLILFDGKPVQKNAANRHVIKLSSGIGDQKPYLEIVEASEKERDGVNLKLLEAKPAETGRVLLDTNPSPAVLSGVHVLGK